MNKFLRITLILAVLTSGLTARSLAASKDNITRLPENDPKLPTVTDTLHITPAMIDSIRNTPEPVEFERKLESVTFVPKGQWIAGVSVSYSMSDNDKYQFFVLENLNGDTYSVKVSPKVLYAIKDDMALGLRFSYDRGLTKLKNAQIVAGEGTEFDINHLYSLSHNYSGTLLFRNYFSLGRSKRFGFFSEIQAEFGGGQSKITRGVGESLTGTYERNFHCSIGVVPGLVAFLSNYSAVEVNIGVLGFSYTDTKSISDQIYVAHRKSKSANFRINLLSITFGATFYL